MSTASGAPQSEAHSLPYNLGLLVLVAALFGIALAYWIDAAGRQGTSAETDMAGDRPITRSLGGRELQIPSAWFRDGGSQSTGFSKQIDLQLVLPLGADGQTVPILVTLVPRSQVRPSSSLLDGVYLHQFQPEQLNGPPGLVGKPLVALDGYEGETVWYDPLSSNPFAAKCLEPVAEEAASRCIRTVYLGTGIAAIYDFEASVLASWRQFDTELKARLSQIGAL